MGWLIFWFMVYFVRTSHSHQNWVDPYDMSLNSNNEINLVPSSPNKGNYEEKCIRKDCITDIYFKRLVSYLISQLDTNTYLNKLSLQLNEADHDFLLDFIKIKEIEIDDLRKVDAIISNSLRRSYYERISNSFFSFKQLYELLFSTSIYFMILAIIIIYKMLTTQFSLKFVIKYFLIYAYLIDFFMSYQQLLKEAEVQNMIDIKTYETVPLDCNINNMSLFTYIKFQIKTTFGNSDCTNYYKAVHQNVFYLVTPMKVFSHQLGVFIIQPSRHFGSAIGEFTRGLGDALPWYFKILILPILLLICGWICILSISLTKTHFRIKLFHLFLIELGSEDKQPLDNVNSVRECIIERKYIQNVELSLESSKSCQMTNSRSICDSGTTETETSESDHSLHELDTNSSNPKSVIEPDDNCSQVCNVECDDDLK